MALDISKLQNAVDALKAERDSLKAQVAGTQALVDKAVADTTAADQAQVDAVTATVS